MERYVGPNYGSLWYWNTGWKKIVLTGKKKKILILVDWFYPGYKAGGPIQSCRNFVAAMENEYEISILTSDRDLGETGPYKNVAINQWVNHSGDVKVYYATLSLLNYSKVKSLIQEGAPDYIYSNSMYSYRFTILPLLVKLFKKSSAAVVIAPRGMLQAGAIRFKSLKKKLFIFFLNRTGLPKKLTFHATDQQERNDVIKYFPRAGKIITVSNFPPKAVDELKIIGKNVNEISCIYISRIAPKKNLLFFLKLLERVSSFINLSLTIRGEVEEDDYWKECLSVIQKLPSTIKVNTGAAIPNDEVMPLIQEHHLLVLPTLGENFGHALFESFAAGRPVLISDRTPWHHLAEHKAGWDIPLDNENAFLNAIEKAAGMQQDDFSEWCKGARTYYEEFIKRSDLKEQYLKLFS